MPVNINLHRQKRFFDKTRDTVDAICLAVCAHFKADVNIVRSRSRRQPFARVRMIVMYVTRKLTELSHHKIGYALMRDHSTIVSGTQEIAKSLEFDPILRYDVALCLEKARAALEQLASYAVAATT